MTGKHQAAIVNDLVGARGPMSYLRAKSRAAAFRDEVRAEMRHEIAAYLRNAKVPEPADEAEEHVNQCLDGLADEIERGRG